MSIFIKIVFKFFLNTILLLFDFKNLIMLKYHCTNCSYVYSPYIWDLENDIEPITFFEDLDENWICPTCHESKDAFIEIKENLQEISNINDILPQEETHVPFYSIKNNKILVNVWTEDNPFLWDENHFVEYVWIFDENGDVIDIKYLPDFEELEYLEFDLPDEDFFEIRSSCNLHWVWKGINVKDLKDI